MQALAQQQSDVGRVIVPAAKPQPYFIWPDDLHAYKGEYYLSNGKKMYINRIANHLYAQVGKQSEREIVATGENMFESVDRSMTLNIVISHQGYVSGSIVYQDEDLPDKPLAYASLMTR
ncbi:hypothetical protein ASE26_14640 [Duganella sp. Root198D2]|nr:hypothetical protein ASD07_15580 [Duganella sp. Root336D2]KRB81583.1 hypothetical protein ASE26_14640 [Duganella sp. Root198D2]